MNKKDKTTYQGTIISSTENLSICKIDDGYLLVNKNYKEGEFIEIDQKNIIRSFPSLMNLLVEYVEEGNETAETKQLIRGLLDQKC